MKKYSTLIKESDQTVILDDGRGGNSFEIKKYGEGSISIINKVIFNYIKKVYGTFGFRYSENIDMNIHGLMINSEYISKMVNNYTIFKSIIRNYKINDSSSLYNCITSNIDDIYGYKGDFFKKETLPILINTIRKGNLNEKEARIIFSEYSKSKNLPIIILDPTIEEDISGIDAKFLYNGKMLTIQIKPMTGFEYIDDKISIKSQGSLSLNTNYLIVFNSGKYIILKNPNSNRIEVMGDRFITSKNNILSIN